MEAIISPRYRALYMLRFFHSYLFQKVWEIFICCNMLSGSIFYVFFNRKTIGPKKIELGRRGPKFQTIFFGNFHFFTFLMLENRRWPMEIRPQNASKHSNSILCIILKLLSPPKVFWLEHFLGRNPSLKFKTSYKQLKIVKKWLSWQNLSSNVRGSNLPVSAVSTGPKWAFKVFQTFTSAHSFSVQTRLRPFLRPKSSGPKSMELKNTKLWKFVKFVLKNTFLNSFEMTSADSKLTWKRL